MRYRVLASASLGVLGLALVLAAPASAMAKKPLCPCDCPHAKAVVMHRAPVHHILHQAARVETSDYAENYYDYHSESEVDEHLDHHRHRGHWRVAPPGFVPPPPEDTEYSEDYGDGYAYGFRNGTLDNSFNGGVGYYAGAEAGGYGGGTGYADSGNGPTYNSYNQSFGGNASASRMSTWHGYNFKAGISNGY